MKMRDKDRTKNPLDNWLRSCPTHKEMQSLGYRSTEKDYRDLVAYADQVFRINNGSCTPVKMERHQINMQTGGRSGILFL
jgi:hypothetical protein